MKKCNLSRNDVRNVFVEKLISGKMFENAAYSLGFVDKFSLRIMNSISIVNEYE